MKSVTSPDPSEINFRAKHTLFVEGSKSGLDVSWLRALCPQAFDIRALGFAANLKAVAESLQEHHPNYHFIIDRDHLTDEEVEASWQQFPQPGSKNLLIWRKKELENYFLDPDFFKESSFLRSDFSEQTMQETLCDWCSENLFREAANSVIVSRRESMKRKWVEVFKSEIFAKVEDAESALFARLSSGDLQKRTVATLNHSEIVQAFRTTLELFSGGNFPLVWGQGDWLNRWPGKSVFHRLVSKFCRVEGLQGRVLQGQEAQTKVAQQLLTTSNLPNDFQQVRGMLAQKTLSP